MATVKKSKGSKKPLIIGCIIVLAAIAGGAAFLFMPASEGTASFKSVCTGKSKYYTDLCNNVGSYARALYSVDPVNDRVYGQITGVAWRRSGNIISRPNEVKRYSPGNNYYYIICPEGKQSHCMLQIHESVKVVSGK